MLWNKGETHSQWVISLNILLNTKSLKLDPTIIEQFSARPVAISLCNAPNIIKMGGAVRNMAIDKVVGLNSLPIELLKIEDPVFLQHSVASFSPGGGREGGKGTIEVEGRYYESAAREERSFRLQ